MLLTKEKTWHPELAAPFSRILRVDHPYCAVERGTRCNRCAFALRLLLVPTNVLVFLISQAMLRRRRGDGTSSTSRSNEEHVRLNYTKPGSSCGGGSSDGKERVSAPPSPGRGGDVGLGDLDPTISRLVRKLTSKKWVLLYDSLKTTFTLQAQCIARETAFAVQPVAANEAAMNASGTGNGLRRANCDDAELEGLRGCIAAWEAYKEWCEEVM